MKMRKLEVIVNNDGVLRTHSTITSESVRDICIKEFNQLVDSYKAEDDSNGKDLDFIITDEWSKEEVENGSVVSMSKGATIDYEMGDEYRYDVSIFVKTISRKSSGLDMIELAQYLSSPNGECSDEDFAELMVRLYRSQNNPEFATKPLTKEDMTGFKTEEFAKWIKNVLDEIIFSEEIDTSAWWKKKDKNE